MNVNGWILLVTASIFIPDNIIAATIRNVIEGSKPKMIVFMSRGEIAKHYRGDKVRLKTHNAKFSGIVTSIKNQKISVRIRKGSRNLYKVKRGSLISIRNITSERSFIKKPRPSELPKKSKVKLTRKSIKGSEKERMGKSLSLDVEGGFAGDLIPTGGITIGSTISRNTIVEFNYSRGIKDMGEVEAIQDELTLQNIVEHEALSLRVKRFFGNSFYANGGLGARKTTVTGHPVVVTELFPVFEGPLFSKSRADAVFDFSVGNKWQFSTFNFGIDWAGISAPISKIRLPQDGDNLANSNSLSLTEIKQFIESSGFDDSQFLDEPGTSFSSRIYFGFSF